MSSIALLVEVSAKDAVLGDGRHGVLPVMIDLDLLTTDQRVLLAELTREPKLHDDTKRFAGAYIQHEQYSRILNLPAATQAMVAAWLDSVIAERADRKAKEEREAERKVLDARKEIERCLELPAEQWVRRSDYEKKYLAGIPTAISGNYVNELINTEYAERYRAKWSEATTLAEQKTKQLQTELEATEVAKREAAAVANARLKAWALSHGSERLKLMLEMKVGDWQAIARYEFFVVNYPTLAGLTLSIDTYRDIDDYNERRKPTLEELQVLKEALALCEAQPTVYCNAQLGWASVKAESEDGEEETTHFPIILLDIISPDGEETRVAARIQTETL